MTSISNNTKLIGKGSYGCIFKPGFTPKKLQGVSSNNKGNKTKKISKLLIKSKDNELKQLKRLHEINSDGKYHAKFNPENNIIETDETEEIIQAIKTNFSLTEKDCKLLSNFNKGDKYIVNMEFGGSDVNNFLNSIPGVLTLKQTKQFLSDYINLLDGLILFRDNKIAHMDIKTLNIVYNLKLPEHRMRFIDFGLMIDLREYTKDTFEKILTQTRNLYVYDYESVYPPEVLLLVTEIYNFLYNYVKPMTGNNNMMISGNITNVSGSDNRKTVLIENISSFIIRGNPLSQTRLGKKFLNLIDLYIKIFERNIQKYNYNKNTFKYYLSKKIIKLLDTYSILSVLSSVNNKLNNNNLISTKILSLKPNYDGTDKLTLFTMPELEVIRSNVQYIIQNIDNNYN